jgi:hypothetical protein
MKAKKKTLKLTMTFPPHMGAAITKHAKLRKATPEMAVRDLVYFGLMSIACLDAGAKFLDKIFR